MGPILGLDLPQAGGGYGEKGGHGSGSDVGSMGAREDCSCEGVSPVASPKSVVVSCLGQHVDDCAVSILRALRVTYGFCSGWSAPSVDFTA